MEIKWDFRVLKQHHVGDVTLERGTQPVSPKPQNPIDDRIKPYLDCVRNLRKENMIQQRLERYHILQYH